MGELSTQQQILRWTRRVALSASVLGVLYLFWRFERVALDAAGCSPLWEVPVGSTLIFDVQPPALAAGDVVLFEGPRGASLLARIQSVDPQGNLVLVTDRDEDCPSPDSSELGPVGPEHVLARLVVTLPF